MKNKLILVLFVGACLVGLDIYIKEVSNLNTLAKKMIRKGKFHKPLDHLSTMQKISLWEEISRMTPPFQMAAGDWTFIGPDRLTNPNHWGSSVEYTGRLRVMDFYPTGTNDIGLTIGSASGGVWAIEDNGAGFDNKTPISLQGDLNSLAIGSVARHPFNPDIIIAGTGEATQRTGTGIWITSDRGAHWDSVGWPSTATKPWYFHRITFSSLDSNLVFAAAQNGFYRSTDGGLNWSQTLGLEVTDLAIHPSNDDTILIATKGSGASFLKSYNKGLTWNPVSMVPSMILDTKFAWCQEEESIIYASVSASAGPSPTLGIFKSTDGGESWAACNMQNIDGSPYLDYHYPNQGAYNNAMWVHPIYSNIAIAAGGCMMRTTDGFNFIVQLFGNRYHPDVHDFCNDANATRLFAATDGGLFLSYDNGGTWSDELNVLPVTQFYQLDVHPNGINMAGGTQDNGSVAYAQEGAEFKWFTSLFGDGYTASFNPNNASEVVVVHDVGRDDLLFSTNGGKNVTPSSVPVGCEGAKEARWEGSDTIIWPHADVPYLIGGNNIYFRDILGSWVGPHPPGFPNTVARLGVSNRHRSDESPTLYISLAMGSNSKMWKKNRVSGLFYDISVGLDTSSGIYYEIFANKKLRDVVVITAVPNSAKKVLRSITAGDSWENVTGNLPNNLPVKCAWSHPHNADVMLVGTNEFGVFRTDDGGITWYPWNEGFPKGMDISSISHIPPNDNNDTLYVVASSYGRGVWKKGMFGVPLGISYKSDHSKQGLVKMNQILPSQPGFFNLGFNQWDGEMIKLQVMDMAGRVMFPEAAFTNLNNGFQQVDFPVGYLPKGIYIVTASNEKGVEASCRVVVQ